MAWSYEDDISVQISRSNNFKAERRAWHHAAVLAGAGIDATWGAIFGGGQGGRVCLMGSLAAFVRKISPALGCVRALPGAAP